MLIGTSVRGYLTHPLLYRSGEPDRPSPRPERQGEPPYPRHAEVTVPVVTTAFSWGIHILLKNASVNADPMERKLRIYSWG